MPVINEDHNQGSRMASLPTTDASRPVEENLLPVPPGDPLDTPFTICGFAPKDGWLPNIIFAIGMVVLVGALGLMVTAPVINLALMTFTIIMTIMLVAAICFLTISKVVQCTNNSGTITIS